MSLNIEITDELIQRGLESFDKDVDESFNLIITPPPRALILLSYFDGNRRHD